MMQESDFGWALGLLRAGRLVRRVNWNQPHTLSLQFVDKRSANTAPYIVIHPAEGGRLPWSPSNADLLADDWEEVLESSAPSS